MGRLAGISAREVQRVAEREGWTFTRQRGSHLIFEKEGTRQRLVIPNKRDLVAVLRLSVDEFLARVNR